MNTPLEVAQKFFSMPYPWWVENMVNDIVAAAQNSIEKELDPEPWEANGTGERRAGNGYGTYAANDTGHNLWWQPREGYAQDIEDYR